MSPLPCQCFVGKHVMGQAWVVVVFFMICACKYFFVINLFMLCSCKYFFVVHFLCFALSLCFMLVIDLFVFSVGFHWVHTTFVLSLLCSWNWTCTIGLCIFFLHSSSYVFFFFWSLFFTFFIFYLLLDALCFFLILFFLFQTLFNCNASLICCFSYYLFWCYFLVGFCKWFVTIFITSHGSIAILLTSFVLLLWMTHKCLA